MNFVEVSVIIPHFKNTDSLRRALSGVSSQTVQPLEVIVVDDASGPIFQTALLNLQTEFNFKLLRHTLNAGQAGARNTGVMEAKGDVIAFLDQDDVWMSNHIRTIKTVFEGNENVDIAYCLAYRVDTNAKKVKVFKPQQTNSLKRNLSRNINILPSTLSISKSAFLDLGGFDENLRGYEDDDLILRATLRRHRVVKIDTVTVWWLRTPFSSSNQPTMVKSKYLFICKWIGHSPSFGNILKRRFFISILLDGYRASRLEYPLTERLGYLELLSKGNLISKRKYVKQISRKKTLSFFRFAILLLGSGD